MDKRKLSCLVLSMLLVWTQLQTRRQFWLVLCVSAVWTIYNRETVCWSRLRCCYEQLTLRQSSSWTDRHVSGQCCRAVDRQMDMTSSGFRWRRRDWRRRREPFIGRYTRHHDNTVTMTTPLVTMTTQHKCQHQWLRMPFILRTNLIITSCWHNHWLAAN